LPAITVIFRERIKKGKIVFIHYFNYPSINTTNTIKYDNV